MVCVGRAMPTAAGVKVARMLKRDLPKPLTCFLYRITNTTTEGFNSVI